MAKPIISGLVILSWPVLVMSKQADIQTIHIEGRRENLVGEAVSASQGVIGQHEIEIRPLLRTGEILELVPGMVVTQHSGTGKANQYFLRGFNLDHGTDFNTSVDGMPVNMPTHGHGQGYTDLNFIIPETIGRLAYRKGAYYADTGDFSGAGGAHLQTLNEVEQGEFALTVGEHAYYRGLLLDSQRQGQTDWLYALALNTYDGPWSDIDEDLEKTNLLLKQRRRLGDGELSVGLMVYDNSWNSADQIPKRAVTAGIIDELGSIDTSVGGQSSRYSVNAHWQNEQWRVSAYAIRYDLNLWSNFTYFLDDEVNGDQFEQVDERWVYGGEAVYADDGQLAGLAMNNEFGWQFRYDAIDEVGLYRSVARERLGAIRSDQVDQWSSALYWQNRLQLSERLRSVFGLRYDYFDFEVSPLIDNNINNIDLSDNGGNEADSLISAKGSLIYTFNSEVEGYISVGQGFHSNDARGTTIRVDPTDGASVTKVDPLVRSLGYELGVRSYFGKKLNASLALWSLSLDSELLFVGDAGNTEASGESQRKGLELSTYYRLDRNWTLDLEYAWSDAEFTDAPSGEATIPGAIEQVLQAGVSAQWDNGWLTTLRVRHFGERPLVEDDSVRSDPSTVVNLLLGYERTQWALQLEVLNLLDSDDHDIDYLYESRLASEPRGMGTEDLHFHVIEPRALRATFQYFF